MKKEISNSQLNIENSPHAIKNEIKYKTHLNSKSGSKKSRGQT